eukprot:CAMPEP_0183354418 /NCGR_PEP_ID=MMETSP0164_2-20130417/37301_1 /TAXON_ID=221442 /ORGANISM="Coccolithus pelagicus ssp braarudi, Strain PLY182g" /LENGTH=93 /DNA_ID=CAMNT_0025527297 /DNA_START=405 /DNA_END=686 /DNA_ORIENTATION=+
MTDGQPVAGRQKAQTVAPNVEQYPERVCCDITQRVRTLASVEPLHLKALMLQCKHDNIHIVIAKNWPAVSKRQGTAALQCQRIERFSVKDWPT